MTKKEWEKVVRIIRKCGEYRGDDWILYYRGNGEYAVYSYYPERENHRAE